MKKTLSRRGWALLCLSLVAAALALCVAAVVFVDPFQIYHLSTLNLPPIDNLSQPYANAGIARQYDYDSAVVGSSVTENFRPSLMDERLGGRFIKLCTSAGTAYNHALLLDLAYRTHSLRRVVYGLDVYSYIAGPEKTGSDVPFYLYNDNLADDVHYWLNRSVLASFLPRALRTWGQRQDDGIRDRMFSWAGRDDYGLVAMYNAVFDEPTEVKSADYYDQAAQINLNTHLIPFIEAHPETQFDFFFPPYSAAEWSNMRSHGTLEAMLSLRALCFDALCGYENVTIYDFSACEEWVLDINNYKDTLHYGQWINDAITECIAAGENVAESRAQIEAASARLREWANAIFDAGEWIFPVTEKP